MRVRLLERMWWTVMIHGLLSVLFGVAAIAWPYQTLSAIVGLFAVLALVNGTISLVRAFTPIGVGTLLLLLQGLVGIVAGAVALLWPDLSARMLVYVIAAWVVCMSLLQLGLALMVRSGGLVLAGSGLIGIVFGAWLAASPGDGAVAIVWLLAGSTILWGVMLVVAGWQLRGLARQVDSIAVSVGA